MNSIKRDFIIYLDDMLTSISKIEEYIGEIEFLEFKKNSMLIDAIIRNFEIIGEAANKIPSEIKAKHPKIPWNKMYGLRNLIAHEYFGIDYEMIWEISKNNLPQNAKDIKKVIDDETDQNNISDNTK